MEPSASPWGQPSTQAGRDWAQHGHTDAAASLASVYRVESASTGVGLRATPRSSRAVRRSIGTVIMLVVAVGSAGSALALRGALFPDVGDSTTRSVWRNPGQVQLPVGVAPTDPAPASSAAPTTNGTGATSVPAETTPSSEPMPDQPPANTVPSNGTQPTASTLNTTAPRGTVARSDDDEGNDDNEDDEKGTPTTVTSAPDETTPSGGTGEPSPDTTEHDEEPDVTKPDNTEPDDSEPENTEAVEPEDDESDDHDAGSDNSGSGSSDD